MLNATHFTTAKTADSSDRTPALAAPRTIAPAQVRKPAGRPGAARRFLDALVRSLAAVHS
jgi:hypothetical protein